MVGTNWSVSTWLPQSVSGQGVPAMVASGGLVNRGGSAKSSPGQDLSLRSTALHVHRTIRRPYAAL